MAMALNIIPAQGLQLMQQLRAGPRGRHGDVTRTGELLCAIATAGVLTLRVCWHNTGCPCSFTS